jgi:hypothetical protein
MQQPNQERQFWGKRSARFDRMVSNLGVLVVVTGLVILGLIRADIL